jgi:hypothetical protein
MGVCPKCRNPYSQNGLRQKTKHHIVPRCLWKNRDISPEALEELNNKIFELCRGCHDDLNRVIHRVESEILFLEYRAMYVEILSAFIHGGSNETSRSFDRRRKERLPASGRTTKSAIRAAVNGVRFR